ncbi:hypothetical protein SAMN04488490_1866 [Marinobacter sp. LV10R510-11A]|uniref:hypothetical protein n=1 Tax=Marinobacter sp. LV10R510-11A TaxID=1415568 RepID=UPI000BB7ECA3|nr:hypothetical protein [Marinobacter sp. LV10R510-11A]SOB76188.1 hypothetical protein SAMN04488490_1866 [Marinobacter sp. LV10R510-11A]
MANAENAKIQYEGGQNQSALAALSDSGDATTFESGAELWSRRSGFEPVIRPDGLINGGAVSPGSAGASNTVDVSALTAYVAGVAVAASAESALMCARASTSTHIVHSITVDATGTISTTAGTEGSAFGARGSAGGPPLIAVGKIEVGQVRYSVKAAAPAKASDIFQVVGLHQERYDFPIYEVDYRNGNVVFNSALPIIHTGTKSKSVYASFAEPIFADVPKGTDYVPAETSHSTSSTQIYGTTLGSTSSTLNQGSFTAYLNDGISDALVRLKNETLWFKFFPNKFQSAYRLDQGKLGISRTFPAGDEIQASCTISPESDGSDVAA